MDVRRIVETLDRYEAAVGVQLRRASKTRGKVAQEALRKAAAYQRVALQVVDRARAAGVDVQALRKARPLHSRLTWRGLDISIENGQGTTRHWHDPHTGRDGAHVMVYAYGYFRRTEGADGEHLDVYVGPHLRSAEDVFVIEQAKAPEFTAFDEHKVMIGFSSPEDAKAAYLRQYDDPRFFQAMYRAPADLFARVLLDTGKAPPVEWMALVEHGVQGPAAIGRPEHLNPARHADVPLNLTQGEPVAKSLGEILSKAAGAAAAARAHKYLRKVPTGNPKHPWRYYYTQAAIGRGVAKGEEVNLGGRKVRVVDTDGEHLTVEEGGQHRKIKRDEWHDMMHSHHGDAYVAQVEKRVRKYAAAVYKHVPRDLLETVGDMEDLKAKAPHVYQALAEDFRRAGVSERDAQYAVAWLLSRKTWTPDARAVVLGAATDLKGGAAIAKDVKAIGLAAEGAAGGGKVGAKHVADVLEARGVKLPELPKEEPKPAEASKSEAPKAEDKPKKPRKPKAPRVPKAKPGTAEAIKEALGSALLTGQGGVGFRDSVHEQLDKAIGPLQKALGKSITREDVLALAGMPPDVYGDKVMTDTLILQNGTLRAYVLWTSPHAEGSRRIDVHPDGTVTVHNSSLTVNDDAPDGLGATILASQVYHAARLGVRKIDTHAYRGYMTLPNGKDVIANGFYTWARLGYVPQVGATPVRDVLSAQPMARDAALAAGLISSEVADKLDVGEDVAGILALSLPQVMATPEGRAWWKDHGRSWDADFHTKDGSASMRTLHAYLEERKKRPPKS